MNRNFIDFISFFFLFNEHFNAKLTFLVFLDKTSTKKKIYDKMFKKKKK